MKHIFILNPYAGKTMFAEDLREKLAQIEDLDYFVFNRMALRIYRRWRWPFTPAV